MKRVLLGAMLVTLFVSCGKSPEEKANALIEKEVKKALYHPETYDPVETRIDSAFTPFDDPAFYEKTVQLYKLGMSVDKKETDIKVKKLTDELKTIIDEEPQFIGFKARHRYRANNNVGKTVFGEMEFLFDKNVNKILAIYDMGDFEYKAVQIIYRQLHGEDVQMEDEFVYELYKMLFSRFGTYAKIGRE